MGLDTVELVMEVEDRFGIKIPDADAEKIMTVGQLHEYICSALKLGTPSACITRPMFYRLRQTMMELVGVDRSAVTPRARVESLLPSGDRRSTWKKLGDQLGVALPPLKLLPAGTEWIADLTLMAIFVALFGWLIFFSPIPAAIGFLIWILAAAMTALLAALATALSRPWAKTIPAGCTTIADLCRTAVLADKSPPQDDVGISWTSDLVYHEVRVITSEVLGIDPERITPDAQFIRDLGAG